MILEDVNIILRCFVKIPTVGSKTVYLIRDHITFQVTYFYYTDIILFNFFNFTGFTDSSIKLLSVALSKEKSYIYFLPCTVITEFSLYTCMSFRYYVIRFHRKYNSLKSKSILYFFN